MPHEKTTSVIPVGLGSAVHYIISPSWSFTLHFSVVRDLRSRSVKKLFCPDFPHHILPFFFFLGEIGKSLFYEFSGLKQ